jgi:hypothetical protein
VVSVGKKRKERMAKESLNRVSVMEIADFYLLLSDER